MRKPYSIVFILLLVTGLLLSSCQDEDKTDFCSNGILDSPGGETEIDCGGPCEPCPPLAALTATYMGYSWVAYSVNGSSIGSGIRINASGSNNINIIFTFVGTDLNTMLPVTDAELNDYSNSDYYEKELSDTGSVTLTSHDVVRKIISGRFAFSMTETYGTTRRTIQNGQFSNVRYQ